MDPKIYMSRIVPLVKDEKALRNKRNIRILYILPMMYRIIESLIKIKLEKIITDN